MDRKFSRIANFVLLVLVIGIVIYFIISSFSVRQAPLSSCIENSLGQSFSYESCYDAYSKTIFLGVKRGFDDYKINSMSISFFDFASKKYEVLSPETNNEKTYKIASEKNPKTIVVSFDIGIDNLCENSKGVFVDYCLSTFIGAGMNSTITPLNTIRGNFTTLGTINFIDSDKLSLTLAEKEKIWETKCSSIWSCSPWEECIDSVQRRTCKDIKNCFIPTNVPSLSRLCGENCIENWECEWSPCTNGVSKPTCTDLNSCGTDYNKPKEIKCSSRITNCVPDMRCTNWTSCEIDYNLFYLNDININDIVGTKERICMDKNSCSSPMVEEENCSLGIDVYTKAFTKCGTQFVGIYDNLTNSLISRIDMGTMDQPHLNIVLDGENEYCDYCYDGILNGDEEKIDCGGSCKPC